MNEQRLRRMLAAATVPAEREAEERSWLVVRAAYAERFIRPSGRRWGRLAIALAVGLALLALALTPAGAKVGDWVRDLVQSSPPSPRPTLTSLPTPGRLLVTSDQGPWVVQPNGAKRLLGDYQHATWSPHGLYVAAVDAGQLVAVDPGGAVHWTISPRPPISDPRWSPSGYRIAYRSGHALRVVAGDGTADRLVARVVAPVAPAWQPLSPAALKLSSGAAGSHVLAYVDAHQRVEARDVDSGMLLWRSKPGPAPNQLAWSPSGLLFAVGPNAALALGGDGRPIGPPLALTRDGEVTSFAASPTTSGYAAAVLHKGGAQPVSEVVMTRSATASARPVFRVPGRISSVTFSPNGKWVLVAWRSANEWVFLSATARRVERVKSVADIASQFSSGQSTGRFPRVEGWCCPREP